MLIEAKANNKKLDKHSSQLFRYFVSTPAKFAILTNGTVYKFYTDLDEPNKMDKDPFMEIDLLNLKEQQIKQLSAFQKENINVANILDTASILKYNTFFKKMIEQQFLSPSDEFVKLFLQPIYKGAKTQNVLEKFRPILKKSLSDYINEVVNDKIKFALDSSPTVSYTSSTISTDEEWEAITLIRILYCYPISKQLTKMDLPFIFELNSKTHSPS